LPPHLEGGRSSVPIHEFVERHPIDVELPDEGFDGWMKRSSSAGFGRLCASLAA
jgi:hypothetical protein